MSTLAASNGANNKYFKSAIPKDEEPCNSRALEASKKPTTNVGEKERMLSLIGGGALAVFGLSRKSIGGAALALLGAGLIYRGASGHCEMYKRIGVSTLETDGHETAGIHVEESVIINKPASELFAFWKNLENLPKFMDHIKSIEVLDHKYSHWVAKGPAGFKVDWDAEIINIQDNRLIAWQSTDDSDIANAGSVKFTPLGEGLGTKIQVTLQYYPMGGAIGAAIAKMFGEEPSIQIADDLKRLKYQMEIGEITTHKGPADGKSIDKPLMALKV